jgi:hypothetical protein
VNHIAQPQFPEHLQHLLYKQLNPDAAIPPNEIPLDQCPIFVGQISVFHSAIAQFFAPSNLCGAGGMYQERICSNPDWHGEYAQYDTVFVETGSGHGSMKDMVIGQAQLLFSFTSGGKCYLCALIE